jgi:hypothetical protein
MISFTMVVINICKPFSYSSNEHKIILNRKWKNSMIGFMTIVINI